MSTQVRAWRERVAGHGLTLSVEHYAPAEIEPHQTILFLHGFMDCGATFGPVAEALVAHGHHVIAPDQRGFGRSDWVGGGGYYHFPNYVADVEALCVGLKLERPVVVGHSMGGTVACLYSGSRPERVRALALLEGIGPPAMAASLSVHRTKQWLDRLTTPKAARPLKDKAEALARLRSFHRLSTTETLERHVELLTTLRDGQRHWCFDPLHRSTAPVPFMLDVFSAFLAEIRCPVLSVTGGEEGWNPSDANERLEQIQSNVTHVDIADAGHMVHWNKPAELAAALATFVAQLDS